MEAVEEQSGDVHVVHLAGRLDFETAPQLKQMVSSMIRDLKLSILLDLGKVDAIDSSGLGTVVACLRSATKDGGALKICSLAPPLRELFDATRLDRVVDIFDDRQLAIRSFL